jgi:hypothetical protein
MLYTRVPLSLLFMCARSIMRQRNNTYSHQDMNGTAYLHFFTIYSILYTVVVFTKIDRL